MLAMTGPLPAGAGWAYEFKWDGVRALADISGGGQHLYARSGVEITAAYPELATLPEQVDDALLDGEVVLLGQGGQPSFTALAERMHVRDRAKAARLAAVMPVTYMIFDLLRLQRRRPDRLAVRAPPGGPRRARARRPPVGGAADRSPTGRPPTRRPGSTAWRG